MGTPPDIPKSELTVSVMNRKEKQCYWTSQSLPKGTPFDIQKSEVSISSIKRTDNPVILDLLKSPKKVSI